MPRQKINNYIFYKIVCVSDSNIDLFYVGSTASWKEKIRQHKRNCYNEESKSYNSNLYKTIRENGGWINFKLIEIGKRENLTFRESEKIEEEYRMEYRMELKEKINKKEDNVINYL
tara:strand:- start:1369 stop:1716 length:348 start_codon:yes stop_codon:yes gene_type:complete